MSGDYNRRASDRSVSTRFAENVAFTIVSRSAMIALVPISLFIGGRLLNQLDANTQAISTVAQSLAVTSALLDNLTRRVEGIETRERSRR